MNRAKTAICGVLAMMALATGAWGQDTQWQVGSGDWSLDANWTNGVPTSSSVAWINNSSGSSTLNGTYPGVAQRLMVNYNNAGVSDYQNFLRVYDNASLTISADMQMGVQAGTWAQCNVDPNTTLNVGTNLTVGDAGWASLVSLGTLQVTGGLLGGVSLSTGSNGINSYAEITSRGNTTLGWSTLGINGICGMSQWGGTVNISGSLTAGVNEGSQGGYSMQGSADEPKTLQVNSILLGQNPGGSGGFATEKGSTATITNSLVVGHAGNGGVINRGQVTAASVTQGVIAGSNSTYNLTEYGSLTTGNLVVGQGNAGTNPPEWYARFYQGQYDAVGQSTLSVTGTLTIGANKPEGWIYEDEGELHTRYAYFMWKGTMAVHNLTVGAGTFAIKDASAVVNLSGDYTISADGRFEAVEGTIISMLGGNFFNYSTTATNLWGLGNLSLIFSGGGSAWRTLEIGGNNYGADDPQGFNHNFHLTNLTVTGNNTRVSLQDAVNNGNRGPGNAPEALYVNTLNVNPGATLNLNHLPLYTYLDGSMHRVQAGEGALFGDGQIISGLGSPTGATSLLLLD
jgi:hypothetical protein